MIRNCLENNTWAAFQAVENVSFYNVPSEVNYIRLFFILDTYKNFNTYSNEQVQFFGKMEIQMRHLMRFQTL